MTRSVRAPKLPRSKPKDSLDPIYINYAYERGYYHGWKGMRKVGPGFVIVERARAFNKGYADGRGDKADWDKELKGIE